MNLLILFSTAWVVYCIMKKANPENVIRVRSDLSLETNQILFVGFAGHDDSYHPLPLLSILYRRFVVANVCVVNSIRLFQ